jgi:hypothetical protein
MSQVKRVEPGSVEIRKLVLNTGLGAPIPLVGIATQLDIYESIFQPYIIADIILVDSIGLINKFPNIDEMTVDIEFTVIGLNETVSHTLAILDRAGEKTENQDKMLVYKLVCVSQEVDKREAHKSIRYSGKENISDTVINVLKTYIGTSKEYVCEPTNGIQNIRPRSRKPFQLIDELRRAALSIENESHSYVFYEDKYGYKFVTIEKLIEDGTKKIGDKIYTYDSAVNVDVEGTNWRNILYRDVMQVGKAVKQLLLDATKQKVSSTNVTTGVQETYEKTEKELSFKQLDKRGFTTTTERQALLEEIVTMERGIVTSGIDTDSEDLYIPPEKIANLLIYFPNLVSNVSRILVYGDPAVTVGNVIKCDIPEMDGLTNVKNKLSSSHSGNYLITSLRHMIDLTAPPTYTQSLEIIKTGFGEGKPF